MDSIPEPLEAQWLGSMPFDRALALQLQQRERVIAGGLGRVLLVEHPPCLTIGRRGRSEDVLWSPHALETRGLQIFETPRGGEVTLHAPGQLVIYPVVHVGRQIRQHLHRLADVTLALLSELGVEGVEFRSEQPGVWHGSAKLASIGIHVSRGVAVQGLSLNLDVDPTLFGALVSCGLRGVTMLSARNCGGCAISVHEAGVRWAELWAQRTGQALSWVNARAEDLRGEPGCVPASSP